MNFSMIFGLIEMAVGLFLILCFYVLHKKEWIFGIPITLSGILLLCGGSPSRDAPNGSPGMVAIGWILFIGTLLLFIWPYIKRNKNKPVIVQNNQQVQPSYTHEEFKEFCKNDSNLRELYDTAYWEREYFLRDYGSSLRVCFKPNPPQYTQGLYKGSLGDNISVLANAQKKEDYEKALKIYEEGMKSKAHYRVQAKQHANKYFEAQQKLIDMLRKTSGGEKYVAGETADMEEIKGMVSKLDNIV